MGKRVYLAGYELEGMLTSNNYKSSLKEFSVLSRTNPFYTNYPVTNEVAPLMPKRRLENCSCSDEYMNYEYFSVNIYEVTWIKFNPGRWPISNYINKYLPIYTKMHYENRELLKSKNKTIG